MNRLVSILVIILLMSACGSQFNKGITNKRELRSKKPPSLKVAEEYDKRSSKKTRVYSNPKKAAKARQKHNDKVKKRGDKYLKKKKRKTKN